MSPIHHHNDSPNSDGSVGIVVNLEGENPSILGWIELDPDAVRIDGVLQFLLEEQISNPADNPSDASEGQSG
jgi:hypothetical protein